MEFTREEMSNSLIANTKMTKVFMDGIHRIYEIKANDGYVLHVKGRDFIDIDPITGEEIYKLGYTRVTVTCSASYNFEENPQEYFAVLESSVPADQVFGGGNNNHEVM